MDRPDIESSSGIVIPALLLRDYGCHNCVWRSFDRCPHGHTGESFSELGYCDELLSLLASFLDDDDSLDTIHERYQLYVQKEQANADHASLHKMQRKLNVMRKRKDFGRAYDELEMRINAYKMWWLRVSEQATRGYSKLNDRKSRKKDKDINVNHTLDLTQLHRLMDDARATKVIESKELKKDELRE